MDSASVQEVVRKGVTDMKLLAAAKPRPLVRKFQVLLFPEQDARLFYRIVFGRWFLMLMILFALSCLYRFGIHRSDNQQKIQMEQLENDRIRKAWNNMYSKENKSMRTKIEYIPS